jgi:hypothetical protein
MDRRAFIGGSSALAVCIADKGEVIGIWPLASRNVLGGNYLRALRDALAGG